MESGREKINSDIPAERIPESQEAKREKIIDSAARERREILNDIFTSRTADVVGNLIPGLDIVKMTSEVIAGKTTSGKKLSRREQFAYTAISGSIALSYAAALSDMPPEVFATARGTAAALATIEFGPEMIEDAAAKIKNKYPKAASLLENIAKTPGAIKEKIIESTDAVKNYLKVGLKRA